MGDDAATRLRRKPLRRERAGVKLSDLGRASGADDRENLFTGGGVPAGMCFGEMGLDRGHELVLVLASELEAAAFACCADRHGGSLSGAGGFADCALSAAAQPDDAASRQIVNQISVGRATWRDFLSSR